MGVSATTLARPHAGPEVLQTVEGSTRIEYQFGLLVALFGEQNLPLNSGHFDSLGTIPVFHSIIVLTLWMVPKDRGIFTKFLSPFSRYT